LSLQLIFLLFTFSRTTACTVSNIWLPNFFIRLNSGCKPISEHKRISAHTVKTSFWYLKPIIGGGGELCVCKLDIIATYFNQNILKFTIRKTVEKCLTFCVQKIFFSSPILVVSDCMLSKCSKNSSICNWPPFQFSIEVLEDNFFQLKHKKLIAINQVNLYLVTKTIYLWTVSFAEQFLKKTKFSLSKLHMLTTYSTKTFWNLLLQVLFKSN
jgi:hypothetical protein